VLILIRGWDNHALNFVAGQWLLHGFNKATVLHCQHISLGNEWISRPVIHQHFRKNNMRAEKKQLHKLIVF
jgi:hypothetical protein